MQNFTKNAKAVFHFPKEWKTGYLECSRPFYSILWNILEVSLYSFHFTEYSKRRSRIQFHSIEQSGRITNVPLHSMEHSGWSTLLYSILWNVLEAKFHSIDHGRIVSS